MDLRNVTIKDPQPDEPIGRYVTNALGQREWIVMESRAWKYFDWLARDTRARPIEEWVRECDLARGDQPLGEALQDWIGLEFEASEKDGRPRPPYLPRDTE